MTSSLRDADDFYAVAIRRILLGVMFCVVMGAAGVEAMYRLPCFAEMRMAWRADAGRFPFTILCWSRHLFGGSLLKMRLPELLALAVVLTGLLWWVRRISVRVMLYSVATVVTAVGLVMVREVRVMRAERHAVFELRDGVERMLAPGEDLVVDDERLAWLLDWYGSANEKAALTVPDVDSEAVWDARSFEGLGEGGEAVLVGNRSEFSEGLRGKGLSVRKGDVVSAEALAMLSRMYGEDVGVYFVTRGGGDVSSKP
ncbi:MAG: hypothetical protein V4555_21365 [Acidobacteriota bacterium]